MAREHQEAKNMGGVHRDVLRDMGNCEPNSQRLGLFHPGDRLGFMRIKEWPGWEGNLQSCHPSRTVQERLRRLVESTSWATVEAGTRGGNPFYGLPCFHCNPASWLCLVLG